MNGVDQPDSVVIEKAIGPLRRAAFIALLAIAAAAPAGCSPQEPPDPNRAASAEASGPTSHVHRRKQRQLTKARTSRRRIGTAAYMLARIRTKTQAAAESYDRDRFGGWVTRGGCTTRQRVLRAESRRGQAVDCHVRRGLWISAYDGLRSGDESELDIDHLVPLGEAWVSGASRWSAGTRIRYANDLGYSGTLRAVSAGSNRSKGDRDPAEWMPPRQIHHCKYIGTWIAVKYRWRLSMDTDERAVLRRYVDRCKRKSDVPIPHRAKVRIAKQRKNHRNQKANGRRSGGRLDRRYSSCKQAIANGLGPYVRGRDPEYRWYVDRDDDNKVCE